MPQDVWTRGESVAEMTARLAGPVVDPRTNSLG